MYQFQQFDTKQFIAYGKQFSDAAFRAHGLAVATFEKALDAQVKTLENRVNATVEFWSAAAEVRDFEAARTLFPKSAELAKDSAEKYYTLSQELTGLSIKAGEQLSEIARGSLETANEAAKTGFAQASQAAQNNVQAASEQIARAAEAAKRK